MRSVSGLVEEIAGLADSNTLAVIAATVAVAAVAVVVIEIYKLLALTCFHRRPSADAGTVPSVV